MTYNPYQDDTQFPAPPLAPQSKKSGGCLVFLFVLAGLAAAGYGVWTYVLHEQWPGGEPEKIIITESPAATPEPGQGGQSWGTIPTK
ncbi:hypothetical protein CKALI_02545 [Corynebacterium kalinowskii]|uniref:Uncharacterized protein n=1 Tax=Corynebacterium kalinowskii TaxID=2675216 RepID=A0A6B8W121_9CORY|nr:hypothetical protein [Corynebacterium kalinowskii]QGU01398.1 hypothetical protein CKALI_02545 [Corynebacterium kalinowskii]